MSEPQFAKTLEVDGVGREHSSTDPRHFVIQHQLNGRNVTVADTLNCDCIFEPSAQRAWMDRLAHRHNVHDDMLTALKAIEDWWLTEEMKNHTGAPYAIFAVRAAIAKATS